MDRNISKLKELLGTKDKRKSHSELSKKISLFESENNLLIPQNLIDFFFLLDNVNHELDKDLYQFYPFNQFKSVERGLAHWGGLPDYRNIVATLEQCENCFVFADYMSHLFAYAIRLNRNITDFNEVYLICGDKYKILANSFSGFLELYLNDSIELKTI